MSKKPNPQKAIVLKRNQRRRGRRRQVKPEKGQWQPHRSDQALDAWGVALRTLREQGHEY